MGVPECRAVLDEAGIVLTSPEGRHEAHALLARGASTAELLDMFVRHANPTQAAQARAEMAELPDTTIMMIAQAWLLAESAGKPLTLTSVAPERPIEAARNRRVDLAVSMDEGGVRVALSHIPGRHATWFRSPAAV
ncbi:MAG: hypothetical protein U0360_10830 [Dehalococcoidia bacterium]